MDGYVLCNISWTKTEPSKVSDQQQWSGSHLETRTQTDPAKFSPSKRRSDAVYLELEMDLMQKVTDELFI